ncbi:hypothetical protein G9A89_023964 [Geosiphon pyriformis]|nr:hypothetical protein G9A89_023964 [Geosiphon pyriformis]
MGTGKICTTGWNAQAVMLHYEEGQSLFSPHIPIHKRVGKKFSAMRSAPFSRLLRNLSALLTIFLIFSTTFYIFGGQSTLQPLKSRASHEFDASSTTQKFLVFVDGSQQAKLLHPIFCKFAKQSDRSLSLNVVVTGSQRGMSGTEMTELINQSQFHNCSLTIFDLDVGHSSRFTWSSEDYVNTLSKVFQEMLLILGRLKPEIVFYVKDFRNSATRGLVAAISDSVDVTGIGVHLNEIEYLDWLPNLTIDTLKYWNTPKIYIQIITQDRPDSFSRLLRSLESSYSLGDEIPLTINMDQGADPITIDYAQKFKWRFGPVTLRHRVQQGGLLPAIVESFYPANEDEYAVLLEDDVEVSPFFYIWIKYNVLKYRYGSDRSSSKRMFGVSLYSPNHLELNITGRKKFDPSSILKMAQIHEHSPYLTQVPCSWGAVYFPEIWREFHEYLTGRMQDIKTIKLQNITVPDSRSNRWKNSWKRFFIELVYLRGYVMLYPNFNNFASLSTNHAEYGMHIHQQRQKSPHPFEIPLIDSYIIVKELPNERLADYNDLPVLDLWGKLVTGEILVERGQELQFRVSDCPPETGYGLTYSAKDLLCVDEYEKAVALAAYEDLQRREGKKNQ